MQDLIYHVAISADGFIAHLDHTVTGFLESGEHVDAYFQEIEKYQLVMMGRRTYEYGYSFGMKPGDVPYPHLENWVFSQSLDCTQPGFEGSDLQVYSGANSLEQIKAMKVKATGPIWLCGGGHFASSLYQAGLIDTLILKVNPILLGAGIKLFEHTQSQLSSLDLESHHIYANGVLRLQYRLHSRAI